MCSLSSGKSCPLLFEAPLQFICHEIIKSLFLICGNTAKISHGTNHFDKRFFWAETETWQGDWVSFYTGWLCQIRSMLLHVIDPLFACVCVWDLSTYDYIQSSKRRTSTGREGEKKQKEKRSRGLVYHDQSVDRHSSNNTHKHTNYTLRLAACLTYMGKLHSTGKQSRFKPHNFYDTRTHSQVLQVLLSTAKTYC